ncbi:MAG: hypothetical protein NZU63_12985 [Gemmataceae bacterium]|nr:hypothetical protein [Gemmataceae bacterium]MDW8244679.1 hypothetical protein [Thermogemmata sp.]
MIAATAWLWLITLSAVAPGEPAPAATPVRVTLVVILASTATHDDVDPPLEELAREVRKREPQLRCFRLLASHAQSILPGRQASFPLIEKQEATVKIEAFPDERGRVRITLTAPGINQLTYACVCDKYFPVVTPYRTRNGQTLILALMAKPCTLHKQQNDQEK